MFRFKNMDALLAYLAQAEANGEKGFRERRSRERCNGKDWQFLQAFSGASS